MQFVVFPRIFGELQGVRQDFERQIERIGSLRGDLQTRIKNVGSVMETRLTESDEHFTESLNLVRRQHKITTVFTSLIVLGVLALQIFQIVRG